VLHRKSLS